MERIQVSGSLGTSHLAYRLDHPEHPLPDAPVILYLHGFGSSQQGEKAEFFRQRSLEEGLAFCSFDFQGHGESGGGMRGLTMSRNLGDVARVHQELEGRGYGRTVILGSSMGGLTGLWYAARHPEKVAAGLHIAPAVDLGQKAETWFGADGLERWQRQGFMEIQTELVKSEIGWSFIEDLRAHSTPELARLHRTPTLVLMGKKDTSVDWQRVVSFLTECTFEGVELHLFSDGDHRLLDRKERLWRLMVDFLSSHGLLQGRRREAGKP